MYLRDLEQIDKKKPKCLQTRDPQTRDQIPKRPGFLQWHEVALQLPKCTQCTAQHQQQAQQCVQGTALLRWVAPLCVFRRGNSGFGGWGASQYQI
jgi:hypothetical protein